YYYQTRIPIKDGIILAKSEDPSFRRQWIRRIHDHDGDDAREGGLELWARLRRLRRLRVGARPARVGGLLAHRARGGRADGRAHRVLRGLLSLGEDGGPALLREPHRASAARRRRGAPLRARARAERGGSGALRQRAAAEVRDPLAAPRRRGVGGAAPPPRERRR